MKTTQEDMVAAEQWLSQHGGPEWVSKNTPILADMFTQIRESMIDKCHQAGIDVIMAGIYPKGTPFMKPTEVKQTRDDMTAGAQKVLKAIRKMKEE